MDGMNKLAPCRNLAEIKELAEAFHEEAEAPGKFDFAHFALMWRSAIEAGHGEIFCVRRAGHVAGMAGILAAPSFYGRFLQTEEAFWYVKKNKRNNGVGKLLADAMEAWSINKGADYLMMVELAHMPVDYGKLGYKKLETKWVKEI